MIDLTIKSNPYSPSHTTCENARVQNPKINKTEIAKTKGKARKSSIQSVFHHSISDLGRVRSLGAGLSTV